MDASEDNTGFDVDRFVSPPHAEFICAICRGVLNRPVQTPCDHLFCTECFAGWTRGNDWYWSQEDATCPVCRSSIPTKLQPPSRFFCNILDDLKLRCSFVRKGCTNDTLTVATVVEHEDECAFKSVKCPNHGCGAIKLVGEMEQHELECKWREVQCPNFCGATKVKAMNLRTHLAKMCPCRIVQCPLKCNDTNIRSKDLKQHISDLCVNRLTGCVFSCCDFQAPQGAQHEWNNHLATNLQSHLTEIMKEMTLLKEQSRMQDAKIINLEAEVQELDYTVSALRETTETQADEIVELRQTLKQHQDKLQQHAAHALLSTIAAEATQTVATEIEARLDRSNAANNLSQLTAAKSTPKSTAKLTTPIVALAINTAQFTFSKLNERWDKGYAEWSSVVQVPNTNPAKRYSVKIQLVVNTKDSADHVGFFVYPQKGEDTSVDWPIENPIRLNVLNITGGSHKVGILDSEMCWNSFCNGNGLGWRKLLTKAQVSGDFTDSAGNLHLRVEVEPQPFPAIERLKLKAKAKDAIWVVEGARAEWDKKTSFFSPELTLEHPNSQLRFQFLLKINVNKSPHLNGVGVEFIPRKGGFYSSWQEQRIRLNIFNKTRTADKTFEFAVLFNAEAQNMQGKNSNTLLTRADVFDSKAFVDENDHMYLNVQLIN